MHFYDFTSGVGEELKEIPLDPEKCCVRLKVSAEFSIKLVGACVHDVTSGFFYGREGSFVFGDFSSRPQEVPFKLLKKC